MYFLSLKLSFPSKVKELQRVIYDSPSDDGPSIELLLIVSSVVRI